MRETAGPPGDDEDEHRRNAGELLALLAAYEQEVRCLRSGFDAESFGTACAQFDRMRALCARLAAVHAEWVEVLISRFEFTHTLWEQHAQQAGQHLHEVHERHAAALRRLEAACAVRYGLRRVDPGQARS